MIDLELVVNDVETEKNKDANQLQRIVLLANILVDQQNRVTDLENQLKTAKEAVSKTEREDLPLLMKEVGLKEFKLDNGALVELLTDVKCGITEARKPAAHKWLVDNGFSGLIKTEVVVPFDRGTHDEAIEMAEELIAEGHECNIKESVHAQTLKSFVKEQLEAGAALPMDLFGVFSYEVVEVTMPKPKKAKK